MKEKILSILRNTKAEDGFISGQSISDQLKVSRTAVWKSIQTLRKEGYEIEAVNNKGYKLISAPDIMTESEITSQMKTKWLGREFHFLSSVNSTNEYAKILSAGGSPDGTVVVGDQQTAGKGRLGRTWESPKGCAIYISYLLKPRDLRPEKASELTIVAALATAKALTRVTGVETGIKWPNDIIVEGKKVCGILTEMSTDLSHIEHVIIGIGVNVNMNSFPDELSEKAISLKMVLGHTVKRAPVICEMLSQFEKYYEIFMKTGDLSGIKKEYMDMLLDRDQKVQIIEHDTNRNWIGKATEITDDGALIVEKDDGSQVSVISGEVSVRGIYGYV